MYAQLRRGTVISASAAILLGIAGIQAGIAQAAVDTPAPSPVLMSTQTNLPDHPGLATPLHASSALQPADGDANGGNGDANSDANSADGDANGGNSTNGNSDHSGNNSNNGGNDGGNDGSGNAGVVVG